VAVTETKRSAKRAYLSHWSWKIALGKCKPSEATAMDGVDIQWDHRKDEESKKGAQEMVDGFRLMTGGTIQAARSAAPAARDRGSEIPV